MGSKGFAAIVISVFIGCSIATGVSAIWGNLAVLGAAVLIFVATLSLGKSARSSSSLSSSGNSRS
jgi:hypothetical protein